MNSVEAVLRKSGLFNALSTDEFVTILVNSTQETYSAGDIIAREGDPSDSMWLILEGTVQIFSFGRHKQEVVLAKLEAGDYFGEQTLLPGRSSTRTASSRAYNDVKLLKITQADFLNVLSKDNPLKTRLMSIGQEQVKQDLIKQSSLFQALQYLNTQTDWYSEQVFSDGDIIFREGDPADKFYFIISGSVSVYKQEGSGQKLLVRLEEGQGFGELALIQQTPRTATVVAHGELDVLVIDGQRFLELYEQVPELRQYMQTLQKVYVRPGGYGFMTQYSGKFADRDAITTLYHLPNGQSLVSSRVVDQDIYNVQLVGASSEGAEILTSEDQQAGISRQLIVASGGANGQLIGATVNGQWEELADIHQMILMGRSLARWQVTIFKQKGSLRLEDDTTFYEDSETLCSCVLVSRGMIRGCIMQGMRSHEELIKATGAGTICGACIPRMKEMLGRSDWTPVTVSEVIQVTDNIRTFRFTPPLNELKTCKPGQHIVVQAQIDGKWVQRSYTLSSDADETGFYEITVKREPNGVFSSWLFEQRQDDALIRISSPQGEYYLDMESTPPTTPIVCFVAGIGMTPGLAMARTIMRQRTAHKLHIHYCTSTPDQFAYVDELCAIAEQNPNIQVTLHSSREKGRVDQNEVARIYQQYPDAIFYLCGPIEYERTIRSYLRSLGVERERIHIEIFTAAGDKPKADVFLTKAYSRESLKAEVEKHRAQQKDQAQTEQSNATPVETAQSPYQAAVIDTSSATVADEARAYLKQFYTEKGVPQAFEPRWEQVQQEIEATGTYVQTYDELAYGVKLAWRNSTRCIGRLFWQGLQVRDMRHLQTEDEMFAAILEHIKLATNGGNLRAVITVFAPQVGDQPGLRLWNSQFFRYAAYRQPDGSILGDPANVEFTEEVIKLGWKGAGTAFDILPIVIQLPGKQPKLFDIPAELVLEVPLVHPKYSWFADLGLRWYALPAVAEMLGDIGGVKYTAAPFNGWYMGTEIGARNFSDDYRYNLLPVIAEKLGLDTKRNITLWKDQALVELNIAVLYSYEKCGVKMIDHHTAAQDFMQFIEMEKAAKRPVYGDWGWLVPPMSGSTVPIFHTPYENVELKPNYYYQEKAWKELPVTTP